jgi:hypothetical protein
MHLCHLYDSQNSHYIHIQHWLVDSSLFVTSPWDLWLTKGNQTGFSPSTVVRFSPIRIIPPMFHAHSSPMLHTLCNWQRRLITHVHSTCCFSRAFAKLRKTTINVVMSVRLCLSVRPSDRPQGTTRFPVDGFSWNFIFEYFSKICREKSSFIQIWQE